MSMMEFVSTADGSLSLKDKTTGELYHNSAGAYTESLENFVKPGLAGLELALPCSLRILDICFGLGYNTWVLLEQCVQTIKPGSTLEIIAIDSDNHIFEQARTILACDYFQSFSQNIISSWTSDGCYFSIRGITVNLVFIRADFRTLLRDDLSQNSFDLIFHDPFSAKKCAQLWTQDIFERYFHLLNKNGRVVTYSAASAVRGGFISAGFNVLRTVSVGKKSGGTVSAKGDIKSGNENWLPLSSEELSRIAGRSGTPYRDPSFVGTHASVCARRERQMQQIK